MRFASYSRTRLDNLRAISHAFRETEFLFKLVAVIKAKRSLP